MEKEQRRGPLAATTRKLVTAPVLAGVVFFGQAGFPISENNQDLSHIIDGHEIVEPTAIPNDQFRSFDIFTQKDNFQPDHNPDAAVDPGPIPAAEKPLSPREKKIRDIQAEADDIYKIAKESGKFNPNLLADLKSNLPFQLAAGKEYNISWIVLSVTQQRESGASDPKNSANSRVKGPYQIDIGWNGEFTTEAFKGLEYTEAFPERHNGDRVGAAVAARILQRNIVIREKKMEYEEALLRAISIYCGFEESPKREVGGKDEVNKRMDMIAEYERIFEPQVREETILYKKAS